MAISTKSNSIIEKLIEDKFHSLTEIHQYEEVEDLLECLRELGLTKKLNELE